MHNKHTAAVAEPEVLSPQWIYDVLMEVIEPDLTSANIKTADEKYAGETEDDKVARYERYQLAFDILDECLEDLKVDTALDTMMLKDMMNSLAAGRNAEEENTAIKNLEDKLDYSNDDA